MSRALNRGYARSPFTWPIDFALLHNDVQWVFDEIQLLGESLASSLQFAGFRQTLSTFGSCPSYWISATIDHRWLTTVDFSASALRPIALDSDDFAHPVIQQRYFALKSVAAAPSTCRLPAGCAEFVTAHHQPRQLTLVISNTVQRALEIWQALPPHLDAVLLHSRFRPHDRQNIASALPTSGIIVATQVLEAGVDLDADLLVTDLAPWPSLVQRFGRVNRRGEKSGTIFWVDHPLTCKRAALALIASRAKPGREPSGCSASTPGPPRLAGAA